jgi:hypothetical protein
MPETGIVHRNEGIAANGDWDIHHQISAHTALLNTTALAELFRGGLTPSGGKIEANAKTEKASHGKKAHGEHRILMVSTRCSVFAMPLSVACLFVYFLYSDVTG